MATVTNSKDMAYPVEMLDRVVRVIDRDEDTPNLALVETGKDTRCWALLNVNFPMRLQRYRREPASVEGIGVLRFTPDGRFGLDIRYV